MTKAELEKRITELTEQATALKEENEQLKSRTATKETVADEVRNFYANYLNRCAVVREWTIKGTMKDEDVEAQIRIRESLRNRYEGAMTLYCVLFEDNKRYQGYQGDRRWSNWTNYNLVSDKEMSKKREWMEAVARDRATQEEYLCKCREDEDFWK